MRRARGNLKLILVDFPPQDLDNLSKGDERYQKTNVLHNPSLAGSRDEIPLNGYVGFRASNNGQTFKAIFPSSLDQGPDISSFAKIGCHWLPNELVDQAKRVRYRVPSLEQGERANYGKLHSRIHRVPRRSPKCTYKKPLAGLR